MNLPNASKSQMREMEIAAQKNMEKGADFMPPIKEEVQPQMHPMLATHDEPSMEIEQQETEYTEPVEEEFEEESIVPSETPQQSNFRMIRERAEAAERRADEAMKYAMSLQQQQQPKQQAQPEPEDDYSDIGLDDDGLAEGKHLKKVLKEMRELKKEMHAYKTKSTSDSVEIRLKSHYPDFDQVINNDNLQKLSNLNPDLAEMILQTPDMFKRAKLAYDMVKQYGISSSPEKQPTYDKEKAIAQKNAAKPRPLTSVSPQQGDSPLSKANAFANGGLSEDMKAQLRKEMIQATKGR